MTEHLLLTVLSAYIAIGSPPLPYFRGAQAVAAVIWGILLTEDAIIALPGFLARHVYG